MKVAIAIISAAGLSLAAAAITSFNNERADPQASKLVTVVRSAPFAGLESSAKRSVTQRSTADRQSAVEGRTKTEAAVKKHVVFIGVDGAQYDQILVVAPGMLAGFDILESYMGGTVDTRTEQPTLSGPGWSTLLTGVWANEHGITTNNGSPIRARVDSLFERINQAGLGEQASIVNWPDINEGHFSRETGRLSDPSIVDYQSADISDDQVIARGVRLIEGPAPVFTFLHLDDVDVVGHAEGFSKEYTAELRDAGRQIRQIRAAVADREAENPDEDWMIIVSTDHGREASGFNHGGQSNGERQTFIASDKDLQSNGVAPATSVAATILDFLGLSTQGVRGPSLLADDARDIYAPALREAQPGAPAGHAFKGMGNRNAGSFAAAALSTHAPFDPIADYIGAEAHLSLRDAQLGQVRRSSRISPELVTVRRGQRSQIGKPSWRPPFSGVTADMVAPGNPDVHLGQIYLPT